MRVLIEGTNTPTIYKFDGQAATLRIEAIKGFTTFNGQMVPPSTNSEQDFYLEVPLTIANDQMEIPTIELDSTEDAYPWDSTITGDVPGYRAYIKLANGRRIPFLPKFKVPTLIEGDPSLTWAEIRIYNRAFVQRFTGLDRVINVNMAQEWIQNAVGALNRASETNTGVTALTVDPLDPMFPIAVAANDPNFVALVASLLTNIIGTVGAVNGRVARADGAGGRTLQDSSVMITDDGNVGVGIDDPIFNDDGTTGANVGRWLAVDGGAEGFAAYFGVGGDIPGVSDRVGSLAFYNMAMGGVDHRTAAIFSFNGGAMGRGNLSFWTAPNALGPLKRMEISHTGEMGIGHDAGTAGNVRLQLQGMGLTSTSFSLLLLDAANTPYAWFRDDGKIFIATNDINSIVAPASNGVFTVGQTGQFSVTSDGDALLRSLQLTGGTRPAAVEANRGKVWYVQGGAGVADTLEVCRKDAAGNYAWVSLI